MRAGPKGKFWRLLVVGFVITTSTILLAAYGKAGDTIDKSTYELPDGLIEFHRNKLLARKNNDGKWQVCSITRLVWQEPLVVARRTKEGSPLYAFREVDTHESEPVEMRGIFVILQISPKLFDSKEHIHVDEQLLKYFSVGDEVIVEAKKLRAPNYFAIPELANRKSNANK